ncbi:MAG: 50S ribosomal protein L30 [Thermoanaerobaculia bacterium]|jgi:large subunit ribosomal protein L30
MSKKKASLRIRQIRSSIGTPVNHREALRGLGLRRIRHEVVRVDTPSVRGLITKVSYLLEVSEERA